MAEIARETTKAPTARPDNRFFEAESRFIVEGDSRFDASFYSSESWLARQAIDRLSCPITPLGALCGTLWHPVQNQARSNFKRIYVKAAHGIPYVGSREMFFFPLRPEKFLSRKIPKLADLRVPEGWLLVSRSGTVGNVLYVYDKLAECAITDHAIRIEPKKAPAGFLYAFLASRYGQPQIAKNTYGSTVDELEPKHLAEIRIPLFDEPTRSAIDADIREAYQRRSRGNDLLAEVDHKLHQAMGVSPFTDADVEFLSSGHDARAFAIDTSELGDRFDASFHVPVSRSAIHKLQGGHWPLIQLSNLCETIWIPGRFKRIYGERAKGVPYLLPSQLYVCRTYTEKTISEQQAAYMGRYRLKCGAVLVSTDGTVGRVHPVTRRMKGWFGSNNLARLESHKADIGFVYAFLASPFGQLQMTRDIYGGVVDHINEAHLMQILIPQLPDTTQELIGDLVREAYEEKDQANDLEDQAIRSIEALIERS